MTEVLAKEHFLISCNIVDEMDESEIVRPFTGGVDLKTIKAEEKKLGLPIKGSYLEFIKRYGSQQDEGFKGIDLKWGGRVSVLSQHFWENDILPPSHILVYFEGNRGYSLNTDEPTCPGEFAVYSFYWDAPFDEAERVRESFAEFWIKYFEIEKEVIKAYKKKHG